MIVYSASKQDFLDDVESNQIHHQILAELKRKAGFAVGKREIESWRNSMQYMYKVLQGDKIPGNAGVAIEYTIPLTSKRVDFILSGQNVDKQETAVIVELKQWSEVKVTAKDAVVLTWLGGHEIETSHPAYQAWTYASLIEDYNETVRQEDIRLIPCSYLHNLDSTDAINDPWYKPHTDRAPVFISKDARRLSEFLQEHITYGDENDILYRIENGKLKPSKSLADSLSSMLKGNQEFVLIDDQKLVYEAALDLCYKAQSNQKQVLIVNGGPGTGKSVVAINLLVELTRREMVAQYVSKNAAPRAVYEARLGGSFKKSRISNLFKGSGSFTETASDTFGALIVDEAHRLNEKSGLFGNLGENQIKELIEAARFTVFFLDEDQRVTLKDIGDGAQIRHWAEQADAVVTEMDLQSQFRCNGSDGYIAWLDNILQNKETANNSLEGLDYDFRVFDSPTELRDTIIENNRETNKSRLVAGYCWDWKSKKDASAMDIEIPSTGFRAQWNLGKDGSLWIIADNSVHEVGCIHTCQGLELDYVGVIIGPDLIVRDGEVVTDATKRSGMDASIKGYKKLAKADPEEAERIADQIIKNTYRTLMSRGLKGCYIYCTDEETNRYFTEAVSAWNKPVETPQPYPGLRLQVLTSQEVKPKNNAVPLYDLKIAAGDFSEYQQLGEHDWVVLPEPFQAKPGYFVTRVVGESMNRRIPNGSWCLFKKDPGGSRNGKIVLVQHRDIQDSEMGGHFTVKRYQSKKNFDESGEWEHEAITLNPESTLNFYQPIELVDDSAVELHIIGELVAVVT
jgi:DUF2075 family protein